ncbi:MAG: ABC transporter permease [Burkholderiaceae bacterium]|nr:MAG: ABC transporter permease [Burkholderiaceae bacterium]
MPKGVWLWSDLAAWILWAGMAWAASRAWRLPTSRQLWERVFASPLAMGSGVVLLAFLALATLDSVHFRPKIQDSGGRAVYDVRTFSLLDVVLAAPTAMKETSYSAPLAVRALTKSSVTQPDGSVLRMHERLPSAGRHLQDPDADLALDLLSRGALGGLAGLAVALCLVVGCVLAACRVSGASPWPSLVALVRGRTRLPWRTAAVTVLLLGWLAGMTGAWMQHYHVLGTDRTGRDVLVQVLHSLRTAFVMGTLASLATLPLALGLGLAAGYLRGWVDAAVQYVYTVLSSIPSVLLIAACVLMVQVFVDQHPEAFATGAERADIKLVLICLVLGATGWPSLCRLIRGEVLKLREMEYVQAAQTFGVSRWAIMGRHLLPNVMHLVLITLVLEFSGIILYEAVLTFVGVGVDPSMSSFGGLLNLARSELSRDPVVWWGVCGAFAFMVALVLAANLFADAVRDAFDPKARVKRPAWMVAEQEDAPC